MGNPCKLRQAAIPAIKFVTENFGTYGEKEQDEILELIFTSIDHICDDILEKFISAGKSEGRTLGVVYENHFIPCEVTYGDGIRFSLNGNVNEYTCAYTGFVYKRDGAEWVKGELCQDAKDEMNKIKGE